MEIETATIVPADHMVAINGEAFVFDYAVPDPLPNVPGKTVHAIQWFGDHGLIEVSRGMPQPFKDRAVVEVYLKPWLAARAEQLAARAEMAETQRQNIEQAHQARIDGMAALKVDLAKMAKIIEEPGPEHMMTLNSIKTNHESLTQHQVRLEKYIEQTAFLVKDAEARLGKATTAAAAALKDHEEHV